MCLIFIHLVFLVGYLTCWNLSEFWKVNAELASLENEDADMLTSQERLLEVRK